jgi:hypothetical protein
MIRGKIWAVVAVATVLGACGDDDPVNTDDPNLTRADVAGQYEMTALTFDPQGSLALVNLLDRLDSANLPELVVASNEDSLQLVFRDPVGGLVRTVPGSYELGDNSIEVELANATEPAKLLLPSDIEYFFDEDDETLTFTGTIQADTTRLFTLVPEYSGEPVTNPLPGTLSVTFTRN